MNIETKDEVVLAVLKKMDKRSMIGQEKYGATMMQEIVGQEKDLDRFLVDVQEELMDALLYIEAARRCLTDEIEDAMEARINIIAQNGNTGEHFENEVYERQANGKGDYKNRGCKRILPIKYTPDFIGEDFIIETKGRANESFPMRWKLFKQLIVSQFPGITLYKPQNQAECHETVRIILEKRKS